MLSQKTVRRIALFRVITLACAAFIFNTTEFIPVALLSDIAQSFSMPVAETGLMITVYAWIVSLLSLPCMLLTAKFERRNLLKILFLIFIICHLLSVFAWDYWVLLVSRIGVALTQSVFWAITASLVVRLAPKDKKAQALSILAVGCALAMVLGLPLGRIVGQALGWRATFASIMLVAVIIMWLLMRWLPHLPSKNAGSLASVPMLFKRPLLVGLYVLTVLVISAHFTAYSYIEPFMLEIGKIEAGTATVMLLIFGLSGIVTSFLFNFLHKRSPFFFLLSIIAVLALMLSLLLYGSQSATMMFLLIFMWGIGIAGVGLSLQMRVLQLAPDAADVAMAIYSGIYNIGIGGGALLGNLVTLHLGLSYIGFMGAILALIAMLWFSAISYFWKD